MYEYEGFRRVGYEVPPPEGGEVVFIPVCTACGRFVKADKTIMVNGLGEYGKPNATCKKCGRVEMLFEGYF